MLALEETIILACVHKWYINSSFIDVKYILLPANTETERFLFMQITYFKYIIHKTLTSIHYRYVFNVENIESC